MKTRTHPCSGALKAGQLVASEQNSAFVFLIGDAAGVTLPSCRLNICVARRITGIPSFRLLRYTVPYLLALLPVWIGIALVPGLSVSTLVHDGAGVYQ